ncbi:RidA family protein [Ensifer sp. BR816]|uniref:RidA family protein n=1 Tax=Rhizobium sp. (strain BR816) TaxID=1057002 RepID=UPI000695DF0C|nr:Rid family detoxifying hydrolase [Ensifer sp. BR816]
MEISTPNAPAAVGPYSQARRHGNLLFVSGQLPLDPTTGTMAGDAEEQMRQVLANIEAIVTAAGAKMSDVLKTTVLVTDLSKFKQLNEIYAAAFPKPCPARATYQVAALPMGAQVEIEAVAVIPGEADYACKGSCAAAALS